MNEILKCIYTRNSVRKFEDKEVEDNKLEELLKAAMATPSARNKQTWEFIIIRDRETLNQIAYRMPYAKMAAEAAFAIAVCGNTEKCGEGYRQEYWKLDCSASTQNILLAAHAQGLGAVWTAVYPSEERVIIIKELLDLPDHIIPLNIIPIGYPQILNEDENIHYDENKIHYEKWKD